MFSSAHDIEEGLAFKPKFDADGLITELKVMIRPLSGTMALKQAMGERFEALGLVTPKA